MTDELDRHIRALHAERNRPMARWNLPPQAKDDTRTDIENRRRIARLIARNGRP